MVQKEIDGAVAAHGMWKARLRQAIESGRCDVSIDVVQRDDQCAFGKWLYGGIAAADRPSPHYGQVRSLHAQFHREAARVLGLALERRRAEAEHAMTMDSAFAGVSAELTKAMLAWKRSLVSVA